MGQFLFGAMGLLYFGGDNYKNMQLAEIHRRHSDAEQMMLAFLTKKMTSKQRWDLVEDYFLGHDEVVEMALGINEKT